MTQGFLWAEDSESALREEILRSYDSVPEPIVESAVMLSEIPLLQDRRMPDLAFARQWLPNVIRVEQNSITNWAEMVLVKLLAELPEAAPWHLLVEPHYGASSSHRIGARAWHSAKRKGHPPPPQEGKPKFQADAGRTRCALIRERVLEQMGRKRRHLLKYLRREVTPFSSNDSLVQVLLTTPVTGFLSVAKAPVPWTQRIFLSHLPRGIWRPLVDKSAPSRAFNKLAEAQVRMAREIGVGETCVDLGAAPGSWTYLAVKKSARVTAVDRAPLRADLMRDPLVSYHRGDAFKFEPRSPVDWLLCDVIAPAEETVELLRRWVGRKWCRHFVLTLKLRDDAGIDELERLKREFSGTLQRFHLKKLCSNKKEVCAFGTA